MVDSRSLLDLGSIAQRFSEHGDDSAARLLSDVGERIQSSTSEGVWIYLLPEEELLKQLRGAQERRAAGIDLPLFGVPFAVKDILDVAGLPTTAACPAFRFTAERTAPAVQRLLDAGAILVGKTNLDQFASGLAGDRTPYGVCRNLFDAKRVAGGSSSGSGVAVAAGLVSFALGTDTAGSGRIPAGCNNIVGLKPTPGLISTEGVTPACRSLDCVSVFALTAADAEIVFEVMRGAPAEAPVSVPSQVCYGVPRDEELEFFDETGQERLFRETLARLDEWGWQRLAVDFRPFRKVAALLYEGPWLAERWADIGDFIDKHPDGVHPATRAVLREGLKYTAVELFRAQHELQRLRATCLSIFDRAQVLVVPTLPCLPTVAEAESDSRLWSRRLGHYTNFVNLLGLAAVAVPAGFTPGGLPGGITLIGPGGSDRMLCSLAKAWQARTNLPLGATGQRQPPAVSSAPAGRRAEEKLVRVAVAGAHLRGQPLHTDLLKTGARFVRACKTAPRYRFLAFMNLKPPRPGLLRDDDRAGAAEVEVYELPLAGFGALVASVAPPLAIGTIELEDGEAVKGFLCESWHAKQARDITDFGGWVAFREHREK
ncbi:hypothetical protein AYO40_00165 [Planctomycetaceae bacterium SCGC AG-212-D15]|nr:hypothetical protein AYO40_00165 [Planctomycetaceae bacterium SCGC AG-212-D15]